MTIVWNDDLKTGIDVIDYQHKLLFETINKLHDSQKNKTIFFQVLVELLVYISEHFQTEENFMKTSGYADYVVHKKSHEKFSIGYKEKLKQFVDNDFLEMPFELINFVEDWFNGHYANEDVKMAKYLKIYNKTIKT